MEPTAIDELKLLLEHIETTYADYKPFTRKDINGLMAVFRYDDGSFHYHIVNSNKDMDDPEKEKQFFVSLMKDLIYIFKNNQWGKLRENFDTQFQLINEKDVEL